MNPDTGLGEFWKDPNDHSKGVVNKYDEAEKGIVGKAIPDVTGGLTNTFRLYDFDLSFLITYQFGGDIFDYPNYFFHHDGFRLGSFNLEKSVAGNYWMEPGDNALYPKPIYQNHIARIASPVVPSYLLTISVCVKSPWDTMYRY